MVFAEGLNVSQLVEGSPWVVVALVMWHLLTKTIPNQLSTIQSLEIKIEKLEDVTKAELSVFKLMLIHHDLTIRGVNPDVSSTNEELKRIAGEIDDKE